MNTITTTSAVFEKRLFLLASKWDVEKILGD